MSFTYPYHFKYPEDKKIYFTDHVENWELYLSSLKGRPNVTLEIGALYGGSSVYILENFCKHETSHHYIMDINYDDYLRDNLKIYTNVTPIIGESSDSFKKLNHKGKTKEFLDLVYIDGNHMSKYVLEDAINSFYCLKPDGIMVFDDFGGDGNKINIFKLKRLLTHLSIHMRNI